MAFLWLAFSLNPFPLDITQGDTMRHQEAASAGGSKGGDVPASLACGWHERRAWAGLEGTLAGFVLAASSCGVLSPVEWREAGGKTATRKV